MVIESRSAVRNRGRQVLVIHRCLTQRNVGLGLGRRRHAIQPRPVDPLRCKPARGGQGLPSSGPGPHPASERAEAPQEWDGGLPRRRSGGPTGAGEHAPAPGAASAGSIIAGAGRGRRAAYCAPGLAAGHACPRRSRSSDRRSSAPPHCAVCVACVSALDSRQQRRQCQLQRHHARRQYQQPQPKHEHEPEPTSVVELALQHLVLSLRRAYQRRNWNRRRRHDG